MRRLLLIPLFLAACAPRPEASGLAVESALAPESFTYEDLVALIERGGHRSLESVLPELPREFREGYTLMHDSLSLQSASFEEPRVIMFGADASLTCTFNGDPAQVGHDTLECFQFRARERAFDFREIRFPTRSNGLDRVAFSARDRSADGQVRCSSCHGDDPRPNWDPYDVWPGAYGALDDALGSDVDAYLAYAAKRAEHPRYRWLIQDAANPTAPYAPGQVGQIEKRPNLRFSEAAGRMNALRARRLFEAKLGREKTLAFAVAALACPMTADDWAILEGRGYERAPAGGAIALPPIFAGLGMRGREWGMAVTARDGGEPGKPWEHQNGYGFLTGSFAFAIVDEHARDGNEVLKEALAKISSYIDVRYSGEERAHHHLMNRIVSDPGIFSGRYEQHIGYVCPELKGLLLDEVGR